MFSNPSGVLDLGVGGVLLHFSLTPGSNHYVVPLLFHCRIHHNNFFSACNFIETPLVVHHSTNWWWVRRARGRRPW